MVKRYKYIDNLLNSYTPISPEEEAELIKDGWYQGAQMAYENRHNNAAPSDADFKANIEALRKQQPSLNLGR